MGPAAWIVAGLCFLAGLLGVWLPLLPGLPVMALGALVFKLLQPDRLSWFTVAVFLLVALAGYVLDVAATRWSAARFGAGRAGLRGALLGGLLGLFFGLPGILLGPFLGAVLGELAFARRPLRPALKAGLGATLGIFAGAFGKFLLGLGLVTLYLLDALWIHGG
ncbi:MAG TPA: DUF456 domain-containing protein [Holophagaceae bacterium]|nr:DUF456 domain-containing protein [Holophagaceae bacterium]